MYIILFYQLHLSINILMFVVKSWPLTTHLNSILRVEICYWNFWSHYVLSIFISFLVISEAWIRLRFSRISRLPMPVRCPTYLFFSFPYYSNFPPKNGPTQFQLFSSAPVSCSSYASDRDKNLSEIFCTFFFLTKLHGLLYKINYFRALALKCKKKFTLGFVTSVCPYRMEQLASHWKDII